MRRIITATLILISFLGKVHFVQAQSTLYGYLIDAQTKTPLPGANVFLSSTKIGTATDEDGRYQLEGIPAGGHRLVVSIIGYKKVVRDIIISPGERRNISLQMKPIVYEMPEIFVGNLDKKWKKRLRRFEELFIGISESADFVEILNPEVLRFETNFWGRLTAEALAPLKIENRALGYHITYYLSEFKHTGTRTQWDGEPLYREMTPIDSTEAAYWKQNRRKAFYGSLRHFLLALIKDRVREEGFLIHTISRNRHSIMPERRSQTKASKLLKNTNKNYLFKINFFGYLEVIYTHDKETKRYIQWRKAHRKPTDFQQSFLKLNQHPVTVDMNGEVLEPYGATRFGYFAFQRLADATPREYRPEGYPSPEPIQ